MSTSVQSVLSRVVCLLIVCLSCTITGSAQEMPGFSVSQYSVIADPVGMSFTPDGTLFVGRDNVGSGGTNYDAVAIHRVLPGGSPVTEYGPALRDPDEILYDHRGLLTGIPGGVLVTGEGHVSVIEPSGATRRLFSGNSNPGMLVRRSETEALFIEYVGRRAFGISGGTLTYVATLGGDVWSGDVDPYGRLFVSRHSTVNGIGVYDSSLNLVDDDWIPGFDAQYVAFGRGGVFGTDLWAVEFGTGRIYSVDSFGHPTLRGWGFPRATALAFGPDGSLYISELENDRILRLSAVPEPSSLLVLGSGLIALGGFIRRRR